MLQWCENGTQHPNAERQLRTYKSGLGVLSQGDLRKAVLPLVVMAASVNPHHCGTQLSRGNARGLQRK